RRQNHDRNRVSFVTQFTQDTVTVERRQHQIEHDQIRLQLARPHQPRAPVRRELHAIPLDLEIVAQAECQILVVFDDEQPSDWCRHGQVPEAAKWIASSRRSRRAPSNSTTNRAPRVPGSTRTRPPCISTSPFTMVNPIPVPPVAPVSCGTRYTTSQLRHA